jgi:glycerol kinase
MTADTTALGPGVPISGVAGDQQSALFGQACLEPGMTKNTYGTGSFVLMNVGTTCPDPVEGLLTTVAWDLGAGPVFALEGSVFVTGAAIQWLRDGLGVIGDASEISHLAQSVSNTGGVFFVPAFAGLGSPWWDPRARGTIIGITGGTGRAELALAVVEAMAFQTRDVVEAMTQAGGMPISEMRVDGGAAVMDLLLQIQADQLGVRVARPVITETTARGAAMLAGLAEGIWTGTQEISAAWRLDQAFNPRDNRSESDAAHQDWLRAVARSRDWAI